MAQKLTPQQIDALVDDNGDLAKRRTIKETFATRVHGFWAGSGMGMLYGGMIGTLVALSAALVPGVGLAAAASMIPVVAGAFALAGMTMGATIMTAVAAPAGAAAGRAKESERKWLASHPDAALDAAAKYREAAQEPPEKKTLLQKLLPFNDGSKKVFSARNALIFGGLALAAGALFLAVAPTVGAVASTLGGGAALTGLLAAHAPAVASVIAAHPAAGTCMALAACGAFGASFGFDGPSVAANSTQYVSDIFSGKKLGFSNASALKDSPLIPTTPPLHPTVTAEEAAQLNNRLREGDRNFTQILTTKQSQPDPISLTTGV